MEDSPSRRPESRASSASSVEVELGSELADDQVSYAVVQQLLQERLLEVCTPECSSAVPWTTRTVEEAGNSPGRFTRLTRRGKEKRRGRAAVFRPWLVERSKALEGGVIPEDLLTWDQSGRLAEILRGSAASAEAPSAALQDPFADLPIFKHLNLLEEAVQKGALEAGTLPPLPNFSQEVKEKPRVILPRKPGSPLWAEKAKASRLPEQPSSTAGSRTIPGRAGLLAFNSTALRGAQLPKSHFGSAASARWVATEGERLRAEAPLSLGSSHLASFLLSAGPAKLEPLAAPLVDKVPL